MHKNTQEYVRCNFKSLLGKQSTFHSLAHLHLLPTTLLGEVHLLSQNYWPINFNSFPNTSQHEVGIKLKRIIQLLEWYIGQVFYKGLELKRCVQIKVVILAILKIVTLHGMTHWIN